MNSNTIFTEIEAPIQTPQQHSYELILGQKQRGDNCLGHEVPKYKPGNSVTLARLIREVLVEFSGFFAVVVRIFR